jgi:nitrogen regulatory protein PII
MLPNGSYIMKVIEAVISTANLNEVKASLQNIGIEKIIVSQFVSNGSMRGRAAFHKGTEYMAGFMTRIKVEVVAADDLVGRVIETIGDIARTERQGNCRIFIHPLVEASLKQCL